MPWPWKDARQSAGADASEALERFQLFDEVLAHLPLQQANNMYMYVVQAAALGW